MDRKSLLLYGAVALLFVVAGVNFALGGFFNKGPAYVLVQPVQPQEPGGKIAVIEFFSYSCPHCVTFDPALKAWVARLPGDVQFRRVHAAWATGPSRTLAQLFYALQQLGEGERLHDAIFSAIHRDKVKLEDEATRIAWLAKHRVAIAAFIAAWNSAEVRAKVESALQTAAAYQVESVPALAIGGKYLTSPEMARGPLEALSVADGLIAQSRAARVAAAERTRVEQGEQPPIRRASWCEACDV